MAFKLSSRSIGRLEGINNDLITVVNTAMKSKHLEGRAVDLVAYVGPNITWALNMYDDLADAMADAARIHGVPIKWGAAWTVGSITDWDGSMENAMNSYVDLRRSQGRRPFIDARHFEMM